LAAAAGNCGIDSAFRAALSEVRLETLMVVDRARANGELPAEADGELLLPAAVARRPAERRRRGVSC